VKGKEKSGASNVDANKGKAGARQGKGKATGAPESVLDDLSHHAWWCLRFSPCG
jgi:hypothetical protein